MMSERLAETIGLWRQLTVVEDGERLVIGPGALLTLDERGYAVTVNGKLIQRGTSTNNTNLSPCQSDVTVTEGVDVGQNYSQIFQVQGDVLLVCRGRAGTARPAEFKSDAGSGNMLSVWLRINNADSLPPALTPGNLKIWLVFLLALGMSDAGRKDLEQSLGYWPGLTVTGLISAVLVMMASLLFKWGWRRGLVLGVAMSSAFHTFEELKAILEPVLGNLGAMLVAICTAIVVGIILNQVVSRLCKAQWN